MSDVLLEMRGITKEFPGVKALKDVSFSVAPGEIHALVGENGAGKSTLMKVVSGVYPYGTYDGEFFYKGEECRFHNIRESEHKGIVIIHQELALIPELSITENIFLGNEQATQGVINWSLSHAQGRSSCSRRSGLDESPGTRIRRIGVGKQQLVEIAKALSQERRAADPRRAHRRRSTRTTPRSCSSSCASSASQGIASRADLAQAQGGRGGRRHDHRPARRRRHRVARRHGRRT